MTPVSALGELLAAGRFCIGEICVRIADGGGLRLTHRDDERRGRLDELERAEAAVELARYDDAGKYRPLKTAPNLRHGWALCLSDYVALEIALEGFYPGRLAAFIAWKSGNLRAVSFRETLGRQSGMYRVSAKIGDREADALIGGFCRSDGGCLRTILWPRAEGTAASSLLPAEKYDLGVDQTGRQEATVPLLCQEICNLLVAAARDEVKASQSG